MQISGFSSTITSQKYDEFLPAFDKLRLNVLFGPKFEAWNYPVHRWHRNPLVRLAILPFLVLPFKMEILAIARAWRSSPTGLGLKERASTVSRAWYLGRRLLMKMWLDTFKKRRSEVPLL